MRLFLTTIGNIALLHIWARIAVLVLSAIFTLTALYAIPDIIYGLEERLGAVAWTSTADTTAEERVTLVVIDEESISEIGPWPWSRAQIAELVLAIDSAGAQLQIHDIVYPEAREGDDLFIAALESVRGSVLAQVPVLELDQSIYAGGSTGLMTHPLQGISCSNDLVSASAFVATSGAFVNIPKGHNAAIIEADGSVRRVPSLVCIEGSAYPSLALAAFLQLGGSGNWSGKLVPGTSILDPKQTLTLSDYPGLKIPVDESGAMRISYKKDPASFHAISASDLMRGSVDTEILENSWVLVGGTAFGMSDIVPTPYSGGAFGVELQARLLASILDLEVPYTPSGSPFILSLLSLVFGALLFVIAGRGRAAALGLPVAACILPAVAVTIHMALLISSEIWLGWAAPALFSALCAAGLLVLELSRVRAERSLVFSNLKSYLPLDAAREIAFSMPTSTVQARREEVTLLSADLRNFSAFTESRPPEESASLLHYFFSKSAELIEKNGGSVHEFRGDGVLALWNRADHSAAVSAMRSAEDLYNAIIDKVQFKETVNGVEPLSLGIGLEQGPVLLGSLGPSHRRSYAVLGETVSIALRIQEMTADLAQPILFGECIARQLDSVALQSQGSFVLAGLRTPHTIFALPPSHIRDDHLKTPSLSLVVGGQRP